MTEDIPEDVMKTADGIAEGIMFDYVRVRSRRGSPPAVEMDFEKVKILVVRAILAERERCAKIAESFTLSAQPDTSNRLYTSVAFRTKLGQHIAAAIRNQS